MKSIRGTKRTRKDGNVLVASLILAAVLAGLAGSALTLNHATARESQSARHETGALYLAEAGISEAATAIAHARAANEQIPTQLGTPEAPRAMRSGDYWVDVEQNADGTITVTSTAATNGAQRSLQAVLRPPSGGIFDNAIFAGNTSRDPNYTLELGGTGGSADEVFGDMYSGGNVLVGGDAAVVGAISATGTITGAGGTEGVQQPLPDLAAMNYAETSDYDVVALFADAKYQYDAAGGYAYQVPESNPAHIFRKHPSDRKSLYQATAKDDYYLEDPWEPVRKDVNQDGSDPYLITLAGDSGQGKVFYVDGNLWVDNRPTYSFQFVNDNGEPVTVTFIAKGNIYFTDNLFYEDGVTDGVAFIAMADDDVEDSGNIYFGDPTGGTLENMDAFMYAENDFIDFHLDKAGTKHVVLNGNMTAGDQVAIQRDFVNGDGTIAHSKLEVHFDNRIQTGAIEMPGLPNWQGSEDGGLVLVSWREVASE